MTLTTIKQSQFLDENILLDFFVINFKAKFTLMKMYNINLNENALEETSTKITQNSKYKNSNYLKKWQRDH